MTEKLKYTLEYGMKRVSVPMLWHYISSATGLSSWFADQVDINGKTYTFHWEGTSQTASLVSMRSGAYVRFHWTSDGKERTYFEMRITRSEMTDGTTLVVTDHADDEDDRDEMTTVWDQQIGALRHVMGVS